MKNWENKNKIISVFFFYKYTYKLSVFYVCVIH